MTNYNDLYKYCSTTLNNKKKQIEKNLYIELIEDLEDKIKDSLIEQHNSIILYYGEYNIHIVNILNKLRQHVKPFNIIYKQKPLSQMSLIEKMCEDNIYILSIDWKIKYSTISNNKFYNFINRYKQMIETNNKKVILNTYNYDSKIEYINTQFKRTR